MEFHIIAIPTRCSYEPDVDILTIALWLGHENTKSTEIYLHADDKLKQQAIDRTTPTGTPAGQLPPPDTLLAFLERL